MFFIKTTPHNSGVRIALILFSDKRLKNRCRWKIPQNKAEDAGILTDSEDDNAVMRNFTRQMLKDFIRE